MTEKEFPYVYGWQKPPHYFGRRFKVIRRTKIALPFERIEFEDGRWALVHQLAKRKVTSIVGRRILESVEVR